MTPGLALEAGVCNQTGSVTSELEIIEALPTQNPQPMNPAQSGGAPECSWSQHSA
jgi:hypothetical protein